MKDLVTLIHQLEVGNVERSHRLERRIERGIAAAALRSGQPPSDLPQRAQHPRPIEALPFTVFAKTDRSLPSTAHRALRTGTQHYSRSTIQMSASERIPP